MKKSISGFFVFILIFSALSALADSGFEASAVLSAYTGEEEIVTVPAELQGLPVAAIGEGCFAEKKVREVTLPDSVRSIGAYAFWQMPLEAIYGTEAITSLSDGALSYTDITQPVTPHGIQYMGDAVFRDCYCLKEVPEWTYWKVPDWTFFQCIGLERVNLPETVESIGERAFYGCGALSEIRFKEGLRIIGENAFGACYSLEEITLPEGLETLGQEAFEDCRALRICRLPASLVHIGKDAFDMCPNLCLIVPEGSCAERYAQENGLAYAYE